jgi:hypothetical protein
MEDTEEPVLAGDVAPANFLPMVDHIGMRKEVAGDSFLDAAEDISLVVRATQLESQRLHVVLDARTAQAGEPWPSAFPPQRPNQAVLALHHRTAQDRH